MEDRIVLAYTSSVDPIGKIVTLVSDNSPTALIITQSGGNLEHNTGALLDVTDDSDWQSGGPATTVAADGTWILSITPVAGDIIQLGSNVIPASGIPIQISLNGTAGASVIISDLSDDAPRTFDVTSSSVTGSGIAGSLTFEPDSVASLQLVGGLASDTFNLTSVGSGGVTTYTVAGGPGDDVVNINSTLAGLDLTTPGVLTFSPGDFVVNYSSIATINVTKPAAAPVVTATTLRATEAQDFTSRIVATFTDADLGASAGDFVASINWGDGTPASGGAILANGTIGYDVLGGHAYVRPGTYPVTVTVSDLGSSGSTVVGGTVINVNSQGTAVSVANSTAQVATAPLTAQGVPTRGFDGLPLAPGAPGPVDVLVATFTDSGTIDPTSSYTASIDWGDGSTSAATRITSTGTPLGTVFSVFGNHTYAEVGSYPVVVTITKPPAVLTPPATTAPPPGAQAIAAATATIADAPLAPTATQPPINATEGVFFSGPVGSFTDLNPADPIGDFRATIDWGDGSPQSAGTITLVTPGGGASPFFQVSGTHTYADSLPLGQAGSGIPGPQNGTYPIKVEVVSIHGAAVNLVNTANVADEAMTLGGRLDPVCDTGISNSDNITREKQPRFFGTTSEPNAKVFVYAVPSGSGTPIVLGQTASDGNAAWSLTSGVALADGSYRIEARAIDESNHTISELTTITPTLVIDTVGPKVADVFFDRLNGLVQPSFQDYGGQANAGVGLNQYTLIDGNNYAFRLIYSPLHPKRVPYFRVTSVTVSPGTTTGPQVASVVINDGRAMRGGHFLFTARSLSGAYLNGIQDIAGNALDGEFYGYFPSGNNVAGGDFVAELDSVHNVVYAPRSVIGSATPVSPPGTPGNDSFIIPPGGLRTPEARFAALLARRGIPSSVLHTPQTRPVRFSVAQKLATRGR
ncbi:MAG: Ig-like domain-containing protein [Isosphaeraceae bacterium]